MNDKEFFEKETIPAYIEVLKAFFDKHPEIRNMYMQELKGIDHNKYSDDPIFEFLIK